MLENFNSHAHVERDLLALLSLQYSAISTHTLTWSVTVSAVSGIWSVVDFNSHAHVERDVWIGDGGATPENFNSHAHVERDASKAPDAKSREDFNSHAHVERD